MTSNNDRHSNTADQHADAILYLLEDPALDRAAFEARLADDTQLGEILAQAVATFHSLQAVDFNSQSASQASANRSASPNVSTDQQWQTLAVIAASILLVGFLGWQTLLSIRFGSNEIGLSNVVIAWGDLQSDPLDIQGHEAVDYALENALAMTDVTLESDVPEWLVMAAADTSESYDTENGKALIQ